MDGKEELYARSWEKIVAMVRALHEAKVPLVVGTDEEIRIAGGAAGAGPDGDRGRDSARRSGREWPPHRPCPPL